MREVTKQAEAELALYLREKVRTEIPQYSPAETEALAEELLEMYRPSLLDVDAILSEHLVD